MPDRAPRCFLAAEWRRMAVLNYVVDAEVIQPLVPSGLRLETFDGRAYVSLVGFLFLNTRPLGMLPAPFHKRFEEVNLRCSVRPETGDNPGRGLVFLGEIVPRWDVAAAARLIQNKQYRARPMRHRIEGDGTAVAYQWKAGSEWSELSVSAAGPWLEAEAGSLDEHLIQHHRGYGVRRDGVTVCYEVEHRPWRFRRATSATLSEGAGEVFGPRLAPFLKEPVSAYLVEGSEIRVMRGVPITSELAGLKVGKLEG